MTPVSRGDILAVRSPGLGGRAIRFGAALKEMVTGAPEPNMVNHVAVAHHFDKAGTLWCLEGRPGGVGWRDARDYLRSPWTVSNVKQPKLAAERDTVCEVMHAMIGTPYDWEAIVADGGAAFGLGKIWEPTWNGQVPGHVVCSSAAAYAYTKAALPRPEPHGDGRCVSPGDWLAFIYGQRFEG